MKTPSGNQTSIGLLLGLVVLSFAAWGGGTARASQAYGTVNNFDTVNDTSNVCHGFEIELDDIHSADITYTYDYNHYGTPKITEGAPTQAGTTNAVYVRYQGVWTNTGWSAHTAIPAGPIAPTAGHAFTNPNTNFGGEHFGVGYRAQPTKVTYFWLLDNGSHVLTRGGQVYVSTPTFTYSQPAAGVPAQAQAVIPAPVLPMSYVCPNPEFSDAVWCKVITTTSQTNSPISINDLMTPDTNNPAAKDWRHGQTNVETETEWQLLQIDYGSGGPPPANGGANGQKPGNQRGLTNSDDVVTYRYEYYAYVGPYADWDTHEAMCQMPGADGIHGTSTYLDANSLVVSLTNVVVVGKFLGAQMSGMVATPPVGLVDHVPDGQNGVAYSPRTVIIAGNTNFTTSYTGTLPLGMVFDTNIAVLFGTPQTSGIFIFTVTASSSNNPPVTKTYPFMVGAGAILPPHSAVDTLPSPLSGGTTTGDNVYTNGTKATVTARGNAGYGFASWTDNGIVVSTSASYTFTNIVNRSLVANFAPQLSLAAPQPHALVVAWLTNFSGYVLQQNADLRTTNWGGVSNTVSVVGANYQTTIPTTNGTRFFRLMHP
jgi:hypothetical protein